MTKEKAFKFMTLRLAEKSLSSFGGKWEEFNKFNNLGKSKLKLIPFFICVANGPQSREKMFRVFDKFYAGELGMCEQEIETFLDSHEDADFTFGDYMLHLSPNILKRLQAGDKIEDILGIPMDESHGAINHSLAVLLKITRDEFPIFPLDTLIYHSKIHIVWQAYYYPGGREIIDIAELKTEKSIYAEDIADRIFV